GAAGNRKAREPRCQRRDGSDPPTDRRGYGRRPGWRTSGASRGDIRAGRRRSAAGAQKQSSLKIRKTAELRPTRSANGTINAAAQMPGTLFVVATPIGNLEDITVRALRVQREAAPTAAEDTRRTTHLPPP